jgi:ABC-type Mn2+/Zn2+ transport system ATPase subunit
MAEIGRLRKNETTEVVVQKTEFHGSVGIDIREYVTSERYTGWSKNGIRIPVEKWQDFEEILDKVDIAEKADKVDNVDKVDMVKKVDSAER